MSEIKQGPLSDAELHDLDDFLMTAEGIQQSMDIAALDGFLTAILCGPKTIMPSEWLRWVWDTKSGEDSPEFESQAQAERIIGLIVRHMNEITRRLLTQPKQYKPLLKDDPTRSNPAPLLEDWCAGFIKGVEIDPEGWIPLIDSKPEWLSTIMLFGTEAGWKELQKKKPSDAKRKVYALELADAVRNIHRHFFDQREKALSQGNPPEVVRRQPVRNAGKVGRNAPCPCGSGKKFKQCHGHSSRLH